MPWQDLGTVTPTLTEWKDYLPSTQAYELPVEGAIFRITPGNIAPTDLFKTYALVRFRYDDFEQENYTRPFRVYPRPDPVIQVVPIPTGIDINPFSWSPQIKKILYPRWRGRSSEPAWTVKIEDYYPEPDAQLESVEQAIAALNNVARYLY